MLKAVSIPKEAKTEDICTKVVKITIHCAGLICSEGASSEGVSVFETFPLVYREMCISLFCLNEVTTRNIW